ncbi:YaaR family protein [Bacillus sp. FJAT-42315]|uniref:YaaR family protein n=1 Tax=Bacillus sp. FJAT-42315 TaxID=2014077 RepID=UPI000C231291|nr:YaaR family protein [Bacillus sp. FJAT-42315]
MKIEKDIHFNIDKLRKDQKLSSNGQSKFSTIVQQQGEQLKTDQIQRLLTDIEGAGKRLAHSRTFQDLAKYKTLVRRFVRETVEFGMNLKNSHTWNQFGEGRKLKIVETIDEKLIELTEDVLNKEKKSVDLLGQIGEIKGLIINLYT